MTSTGKGKVGGVLLQDQEPQDSSDSLTKYCVICLDNLRETRFTCGHAVACAGCAAQILKTSRACPICRARVSIQVPRQVDSDVSDPSPSTSSSSTHLQCPKDLSQTFQAPSRGTRLSLLDLCMSQPEALSGSQIPVDETVDFSTILSTASSSTGTESTMSMTMTPPFTPSPQAVDAARWPQVATTGMSLLELAMLHPEMLTGDHLPAMDNTWDFSSIVSSIPSTISPAQSPPHGSPYNSPSRPSLSGAGADALAGAPAPAPTSPHGRRASPAGARPGPPNQHGPEAPEADAQDDEREAGGGGREVWAAGLPAAVVGAGPPARSGGGARGAAAAAAQRRLPLEGAGDMSPASSASFHSCRSSDGSDPSAASDPDDPASPPRPASPAAPDQALRGQEGAAGEGGSTLGREDSDSWGAASLHSHCISDDDDDDVC